MLSTICRMRTDSQACTTMMKSTRPRGAIRPITPAKCVACTKPPGTSVFRASGILKYLPQAPAPTIPKSHAFDSRRPHPARWSPFPVFSNFRRMESQTRCAQARMPHAEHSQALVRFTIDMPAASRSGKWRGCTDFQIGFVFIAPNGTVRAKSGMLFLLRSPERSPHRL